MAIPLLRYAPVLQEAIRQYPLARSPPEPSPARFSLRCNPAAIATRAANPPPIFDTPPADSTRCRARTTPPPYRASIELLHPDPQCPSHATRPDDTIRHAPDGPRPTPDSTGPPLRDRRAPSDAVRLPHT